MTDGKFIVVFKFDGGLADDGGLDGSDHVEATEAARRLLALHAQTFFTGVIPRSAQSRGAAYHVRHSHTFQGSSCDQWGVYVAAGYLLDIYKPQVKQLLDAAARFLAGSIRSALGVGPRDQPTFLRIEPVLSSGHGNGEPLIDMDAIDDEKRAALRAITMQVLYELARPVGRSADRLSILIDGQLIAEIDQRAKSRLHEERQAYLEDQIGDAVSHLRGRRNYDNGRPLL